MKKKRLKKYGLVVNAHETVNWATSGVEEERTDGRGEEGEEEKDKKKKANQKKENSN